MISLEAWTTIRHLHAQGKSIRRICRELHLSRKAVRRALRSPEPPRYRRKPTGNAQLAPFLPLIQQMTVEEHLIGSRILNEIRARGYDGSAAAFYRTRTRLRPTQPDLRVTERFETAHGEQCQFDWSPYTILLGGAYTRVIVYNIAGSVRSLDRVAPARRGRGRTADQELAHNLPTEKGPATSLPVP